MAYKMFDCLIGINSNQLTGFYMMTTLAINELLKRLFCPGKLTYFVFIFSRSFLKFQTFWQILPFRHLKKACWTFWLILWQARIRFGWGDIATKITNDVEDFLLLTNWPHFTVNAYYV